MSVLTNYLIPALLFLVVLNLVLAATLIRFAKKIHWYANQTYVRILNVDRNTRPKHQSMHYDPTLGDD